MINSFVQAEGVHSYFAQEQLAVAATTDGGGIENRCETWIVRVIVFIRVWKRWWGEQSVGANRRVE